MPQGRSGGRNEIASRLAMLMRLLNGKKHMPPVPSLARECGVTERTTYRDLRALEAARWPLPRRVHQWKELV